MFQFNENYTKLPGSYLFADIGRKVKAYQAANPDKSLIRLGIGDVTQPIAPAILEAMHKAVDEMGNAATFRGYPDYEGALFLRRNNWMFRWGRRERMHLLAFDALRTF